MGAQVPGIVASVAACIVVVIQGWTALSLAYLWAFGPSDLAQAFPEDGLDGSGRGPAALLADATVAAGWVIAVLFATLLCWRAVSRHEPRSAWVYAAVALAGVAWVVAPTLAGVDLWFSESV
jgi:hypothetical protein